ncbi:MAG: DUF4352 domain-containing protein [Candidatus Dormibacteraceae bacterium]
MPDPWSQVPHYTPDGRWYWDGTTWIPGPQVLAGERPPRQFAYAAPVVATAAPARERIARWPLWAAGLLLVALVVAGIGDGVLGHRQGQPPGAGPPPSAQSILRSPFTHHVGSATFTAVGTTPGRQSASGEIFFTPDRAYEITERINGYWSGQFLDVGGYAYQRTSRGGPWELDPTDNAEYYYLDWDGGAVTRDITVTGPVELHGEKAWHLSDGLSDQWWIGVATGHPLQAIDLGYQYTFGSFGKAPGLRAPAPGEVATRVYHARAGQPLPTPLMTLRVGDPQVSEHSSTGKAPAGYRYLSLRVTTVNDSTQPLGIPLQQPVVTSPQGAEYWQDGSQEQQDLPDGTMPLAPGKSESGTLVFDVEQGVTRVRFLLPTAQLTPDPDSAGDYLMVVDVTL